MLNLSVELVHDSFLRLMKILLLILIIIIIKLSFIGNSYYLELCNSSFYLHSFITQIYIAPLQETRRSCHNRDHHTRGDPVTAIIFALKSSAIYSCPYFLMKTVIVMHTYCDAMPASIELVLTTAEDLAL